MLSESSESKNAHGKRMAPSTLLSTKLSLFFNNFRRKNLVCEFSLFVGRGSSSNHTKVTPTQLNCLFFVLFSAFLLTWYTLYKILWSLDVSFYFSKNISHQCQNIIIFLHSKVSTLKFNIKKTPTCLYSADKHENSWRYLSQVEKCQMLLSDLIIIWSTLIKTATEPQPNRQIIRISKARWCLNNKS